MVSAVTRSSLLRRTALFGSLGCGFFLLAVVGSACGGSTDDAASTSSSSGSSTVDAGIDRARLPAPLHPDASCPVTIETPELLPGIHVPEGTAITYSSNPPSSGTHYPIWANFQEYFAPVDDGYLVHDLEHGAILLLYKCDTESSCEAVTDIFHQVRDSIPTDPLCDPDIRVRVVIAPYPKMDVPVAAVAWGWLYTAQCADLPTLKDFANAHYRQGTEDLCAPGRTF